VVDEGRGERIVIARWGVPMAVGLVVVTGAVFAGGLALVVGASGTKERVTSAVLAALLAVPFVVVARRAPRMLRGMGLEIDGEGVRPFDGGRSTLIPWSAVEAVGFGSDMVSRHGTKRLSVAAFEVYLGPGGDPASYPGLRADWRPVRPPAEDLSAGCFSYRLAAPAGRNGLADQLEAAVRRHRPDLWRGPFVHDAPDPTERLGADQRRP
jgi:hypothetical protein